MRARDRRYHDDMNQVVVDALIASQIGHLDGHDIGALACVHKGASVDWAAVRALYRPAPPRRVRVASGADTVTRSRCAKLFALVPADVACLPVLGAHRVCLRSAVGVALLKHGGPTALRKISSAAGPTARQRREATVARLGVTDDDRRSGFVVCALANYLAWGEGLSAFKAILAQERKVMAELESAEDPEVRRVGMRMVGRINDRPWTYVSDVVARVRAFVENPERIARVQREPGLSSGGVPPPDPLPAFR